MGKIHSDITSAVYNVLFKVKTDLIDGDDKTKPCCIVTSWSQTKRVNGIELFFDCEGQHKND
ncbi:hypothetical protein DOY81_008305 [Sarcophaga bullata]|nr:hypothetical protein DOY81_008305 [Sarcophaga bullata]